MNERVRGKNNENQVYIGLGSNINPEENLVQAVRMLDQSVQIVSISSVWETLPVGGEGSNYLNAAAFVLTSLNLQDLKEKIIRPLETHMGRRRTNDRYAPRPIDLDILIFNQEVLDPGSWDFAHVCVPMSELLPEFNHPRTHEPLKSIANQFLSSAAIHKTNLNLHRR